MNKFTHAVLTICASAIKSGTTINHHPHEALDFLSGGDDMAAISDNTGSAQTQIPLKSCLKSTKKDGEPHQKVSFALNVDNSNDPGQAEPASSMQVHVSDDMDQDHYLANTQRLHELQDEFLQWHKKLNHLPYSKMMSPSWFSSAKEISQTKMHFTSMLSLFIW